MRKWCFTCRADHSHGPFHSEAEARYYADGMDSECGPVDPEAVEGYDFDSPVAMFVSEPEIDSHFNRSLGMHVESRKHLKHLQAKHGVEDVVVKPGVPDFVPRDLDTLAKKYEDIRRNGIGGASFTDGDGSHGGG